VVIVNARPALWDELAREHAEVRTRVVEEQAFAWFVSDEVQPVAVVQMCAAADVCHASCFTCSMCRAGSNVVSGYRIVGDTMAAASVGRFVVVIVVVVV
jgi:hypothetical protein